MHIAFIVLPLTIKAACYRRLLWFERRRKEDYDIMSEIWGERAACLFQHRADLCDQQIKRMRSGLCKLVHEGRIPALDVRRKELIQLRNGHRTHLTVYVYQKSFLVEGCIIVLNMV